MGKKIFFIILVAWGSSLFAGETFLCALLRRHVAALPEDVAGVQALVSAALRAHYPTLDKADYQPVLIKAENPEQLYFGTGKIGKDARVILRFPPKQERTIYELLTPPQRDVLLLSLFGLLRGGKYDFDFYGLKGKPSPLDLAIKEMTKTKSELFGTSPERVLARACFGGFAGCCRNYNLAFFGLLIEVGWPIDQIRLVRGYDGPEKGATGHLWLELRRSPNDPWEEWDAQPRVAADDPRRPPARPRSTPPPRTLGEAYPYGRDYAQIWGSI